MSEIVKRDPEAWQTAIERYDKKLTAKVGNKAVVFTFLNTQMYEYPEEYSQFDHAFRVNDDGEQGTYYLRDNFPELWGVLEEHHYPRIVMPYPSEGDERIISQFHAQNVQRGLEQLLEGENGD